MEGAFVANWSAEAVNASAAPPGAEGNRTAGPPQRDEALARVEVAVLSVILFLALSGNACVLLALRTTRQKHSRLFFFMKHLSIADLVVAVFQVLPQLLWDITFRFYGPDLLCRLVKYLQVVGMFASTYLLLLMSLDRCLAICQPLRSLRRRTDRLAVLATWLGCLVASVPQMHIFSLREVADGVFDCWAVFIEPWGSKAYITWITLAVYIVPVIVLAACYGLISFKIWQNLRLKTAAAAAAEAPEGAVVGAGGRIALARVSSVKLISKAKIRTVKMTFIIVLAFIVCWTPFFFVQMWSVWDANAPKEDPTSYGSLLFSALICTPLSHCMSSQKNEKGRVVFHEKPRASLGPPLHFVPDAEKNPNTARQGFMMLPQPGPPRCLKHTARSSSPVQM
ncbi:hypothetical protein P7K49_030797 [Saguinus oedipus]|uniref:Oxytocin receptor n=2 Tax=Callitrichinae TaxID=9480 RepID=A0ABQ9U370_SAGOE|nr:hypothetical protein P7K49_030797 [Saguinus oedipus]